jgi:hypothetical protein
MDVLDTQIISYSFKNSYVGNIENKTISSVSAKEFLLVQGSEFTKANYYIPVSNKFNHLLENGIGISKLDHPFRKRDTDQIILEFGHVHPTLIEFGNLAIAEAINLKAKNVYISSIQFLEKDKRKILLDRFEYLVENNINCIPLNKKIVELSLSLLHVFLKIYNSKEKFKNTLNDVFILATAINSSSTLITKDSLLNRFATEYFDTTLNENSGSLLIDFRKVKTSEFPKSKESKGYINKGWRVQVRNYHGEWRKK